VEHVVGSVKNPMTDAALTAKATDLMQDLLAPERIRVLLEACWNVEKLPKAARLATLAAV
jgi:hypothetical protein